jgi:organic hydroperoxide reductase OsmC/OhrA
MTTDRIELLWKCGRAGTAQTASGTRLDVGPNGNWNADQLLMAAAESAVMASFIAAAEEEGLEVLGYMSSAATESEVGGRPVLRVVVRPCIVVSCEPDVARAHALLSRAIERSPVAKALAAALSVDPEVVAIKSP